MIERLLDEVLAQQRNANALQRFWILLEIRIADRECRVGLLGNEPLRQRGEWIARIEVTRFWILHCIEHQGRIAQRARMNAGAIVEPLIADAAAVGNDALGRENERNAATRRRALTRRARLFANADRRKIAADHRTRTAARTAHDALSVIGIARLSAPRADLLSAGHPIEFRLRLAARIARTCVELVRVRFAIDDRALGAQLRDERRVERRRIHREVDVVVRRGAHVLRVVRVLERRHDAVHRQGLEIGVRAVLRIELRCAFQRVWLLAKFFACHRCARGQRPRRWMRIELAFARDRALAADIQGLQRIDLPGVRQADAHAHLRDDARIRDSRLHAAVFERQTLVLIQVRKYRGCLHRLGGKHERLARTHIPFARFDAPAVWRDQRRADPVVCLGPIDISLHHTCARRLTRLDRGMNVRNGRLFHLELDRRGGICAVEGSRCDTA